MRLINILIIGGARSGKSRFAQKLALKLGEPVLFVATAVAGDEWYDPNGEPINGSSLYTQGGDAIPTNLPAGEDVSIRGRIGNRRGHGIQFTFNNTTGRPRIRAVQVQGSESFRSTQKAI